MDGGENLARVAPWPGWVGRIKPIATRGGKRASLTRDPHRLEDEEVAPAGRWRSCRGEPGSAFLVLLGSRMVSIEQQLRVDEDQR
jgi:hypothetical protein